MKRQFFVCLFFFEEAVLEWLIVLDIEMGKTRREIGLG